MADGLSIVASAIAIAGLAYSRCRTVHEVISNIHDAPEVLLDLKSGVETLSQFIQSFSEELNKRESDAALSESEKLILGRIEPSLKVCHKACDAFSKKIDKLTRHSTNGHVDTRDRLKFSFMKKNIADFKTSLESHKSTVIIAENFLVF
jgi:hypothetical protein